MADKIQISAGFRLDVFNDRTLGDLAAAGSHAKKTTMGYHIAKGSISHSLRQTLQCCELSAVGRAGLSVKGESERDEMETRLKHNKSIVCAWFV